MDFCCTVKKGLTPVKTKYKYIMNDELISIQNHLQNTAKIMRKLQAKINPENHIELQYYKGYLDGIDFVISIIKGGLSKLPYA